MFDQVVPLLHVIHANCEAQDIIQMLRKIYVSMTVVTDSKCQKRNETMVTLAQEMVVVQHAL